MRLRILESKLKWCSRNKFYIMKLVISLMLTSMLTFAFGLFLPWWSLILASFFVALAAGNKALPSFIAGFLGVFLLWGIMTWMISSGNHHILAHRMSRVILKNDNPTLLIVITAFIGGILGGISAWNGSILRNLFRPKD